MKISGSDYYFNRTIIELRSKLQAFRREVMAMPENPEGFFEWTV
jgi:hypothetical protein